jgi:hypothetical protein
MRRGILVCCLALTPLAASAAQEREVFTRADTLRGSNTPQRAWWDVTFYDLHVDVTPSDSAVRGSNGITYDVLAPALEMQIDLQAPLDIDSVVQDRQHLAYRRDGNAFFVTLGAPQRAGDRRMLTVFYHGTYRPGPDGGRRADSAFVWAIDSLGAPWVATEGLSRR